MRTQRTQQTVLCARLPCHHGHGFLALRHWPLADHLAGDDEIKTMRLGPLQGLVYHEDLAIQAGIHIGTIAVFGLQQDILVFLHDIDDVQLDAQLLRGPQGIVALGLALVLFADGMGMSFHAKAGKKVDPFHVDPLVQHNLGGEHGIETARDQGDGFALLCHGQIVS